jgi:hypothetical protein
LEVPHKTSAEFSAHVDVGTINLTNFNLNNPVQSTYSLQGTCGDGEGLIDLVTTTGNIQVNGF